MVPKSKFLFSAAFLTFSLLLSSHAIFVAEKYGSRGRPVVLSKFLCEYCIFLSWQKSAVLRSCHTIAFASGFADLSNEYTLDLNAKLNRPIAQDQ